MSVDKNERKAKLNKQLLGPLKKEIDALEAEVKCEGWHKFKKELLCKLVIGRNILRGVAPYLVAGALAAGLGHASDLGAIPFVPHYETITQGYLMSIRSDQEEPTERTRWGDINRNNEVRVFGNWQDNDDGLFERTVKIFPISDVQRQSMTQEIIEGIVRNQDIDEKTELFGSPRIRQETQEAAPSPESMDDNFRLVEATLVGRNDGVTTTRRQSTFKNIKGGLLQSLVLITGIGCPLYLRRTNGYSMMDNIGSTKLKYIHGSQEKKELTKKLEIRKRNYELLGGQL